MKTAILYASKYGATAEIATRLATKMGDAQVFDLNAKDRVDLDAFDFIIIGSAIYAGMTRKSAKTFLSAHEAVLLTKQLGLYICGMAPTKENLDRYLDLNYPKALLSHAKAKAFLGGRFDPNKAGFFDRTLYKMVSKQSTYSDIISDDDISMFANAMLA